MESLGRFANRWEQLASTPHRLRSVDEDRSVVFWIAVQDPTMASPRVAAWLSQCAGVAAFIRTMRRDPREHSEDPNERRHALWLRRQRARENDLCGYQRHRLAQIGGGMGLESRDDRYRSRAFAYSDFLDERGRVPSSRSADLTERRLAYWMRRQRTASVQQALSPMRQQLVREITTKSSSEGANGRALSAVTRSARLIS